MDKQLNTLENTRLIFENPELMFRLIELMDQGGNRYILESDLHQVVLDAIRHRSKSDQDRIKIGFNQNNLLRSGLIIDIDKTGGDSRLFFHEALINLMRACNASLHQDLTDAHLRGYLVNLRDLEGRLRESSANDNDPDFTELRDDLLERISMLTGVLRENVRRMQSVSADLAEMSEDASKDPERFTQYLRSLYDQVTTLYNRTIHPALVFLNPKTKLRDGANLFATLNSLRHFFDDNDQHHLADQLHRAGLSLNAMYKPIQAVAVEIDHFLKKTRKGMVEYNAMEAAFSELVALKNETETTNMKRKWLDGRSFVHDAGFVIGLKFRLRPKQYAFGQSQSYFNLLFSELQARVIDQQNEAKKPDLTQHGEAVFGQGVNIERLNALFEWVEGLQLRPTSDLTKQLHERLSNDIEGYRFPDLLTVMGRINPELHGFELKTTNRFGTIHAPEGDDNPGSVFVYRKRRLTAPDSINQE